MSDYPLREYSRDHVDMLTTNLIYIEKKLDIILKKINAASCLLFQSLTNLKLPEVIIWPVPSRIFITYSITPIQGKEIE